MKSQHALFTQAGTFSRFEDLDTAELPPIPLADDGLPMAVPTGAAPTCPAGKILSYSRNGWLFLDAPQPEAPYSVTRRQMHRWLVKSGVSLDVVRAELGKLPEPARSLALIDFDAATYERDNPLLLSLAGMLGISVADAFIGAAKE